MSTLETKRTKTNQSKIAPGIDNQDELEEKATKKDIEKGNYTEVITLSYDEIDPS